MRYFESRHITSFTDANLASDIIKHLQSRQYLGRSIIVCDRPVVLVSLAHKYWYKLARALQRERASTVDTEKILRLTKAITHMHRMKFVAKLPDIRPDAHVFFLTPEELHKTLLPINTFTVYLTANITHPILGDLISELPHDATIADYANNTNESTQLMPKTMLEQKALQQWQAVEQYFIDHDIEPSQLTNRKNAIGYGLVDDALDILLGVSHSFLQIASHFQHSFELAQPFNLGGIQQREYEVFLLLAHQVRSLNPVLPLMGESEPNLSQPSETFFLHDATTSMLLFIDILTHSTEDHLQAGRRRLAKALAFAGYS